MMKTIRIVAAIFIAMSGALASIATADTYFVPTSRQVCGKSLSSNVVCTAEDVGAVPTARTVNGKALSADITLGLASSDYANQGTTTTVLHGNAAGNPSFGAVTEADMSFSDNTTLDVSTSKHGLVPKAPNDAAKYLRGDGTWAAPTCPTYAYLSSDSTVSSESLTAVSGMSLSFPAAGTYLVEFMSTVQASTQFGLKYGFGFSGTTSSMNAYIIGMEASTDPHVSARLTALDTATGTFNASTSSSGYIQGWVTITVTTSGTFSLKALRLTSGTATFRAGAWMRFTKLA